MMMCMEKIKLYATGILQKGTNCSLMVSCCKTTIALLFSFLLIVCPQLHADAQSGKKPTKKSAGHKTYLYGQASYYASKFEGRKTANGDVFKHARYTAACNALPLGTVVKVTNLRNGKTIQVTINDRLSVRSKRLLDLTREGASKLGYLKQGLTRVKIEVLSSAKRK